MGASSSLDDAFIFWNICISISSGSIRHAIYLIFFRREREIRFRSQEEKRMPPYLHHVHGQLPGVSNSRPFLLRSLLRFSSSGVVQLETLEGLARAVDKGRFSRDKGKARNALYLFGGIALADTVDWLDVKQLGFDDVKRGNGTLGGNLNFMGNNLKLSSVNPRPQATKPMTDRRDGGGADGHTFCSFCFRNAVLEKATGATSVALEHKEEATTKENSQLPVVPFGYVPHGWSK